MGRCSSLKIRYDKIVKAIDLLWDEYFASIPGAGQVQISFGSSEGSTSSTSRNPKEIRKEIDELTRQADQLAMRCRTRGLPTMNLRRRI